MVEGRWDLHLPLIKCFWNEHLIRSAKLVILADQHDSVVSIWHVIRSNVLLVGEKVKAKDNTTSVRSIPNSERWCLKNNLSAHFKYQLYSGILVKGILDLSRFVSISSGVSSAGEGWGFFRTLLWRPLRLSWWLQTSPNSLPWWPAIYFFSRNTCLWVSSSVIQLSCLISIYGHWQMGQPFPRY